MGRGAWEKGTAGDHKGTPRRSPPPSPLRTDELVSKIPTRESLKEETCMTDQDLLTYWYIGLVIAGVIVVIAAVLLLTILVTARSIDRGAKAALDMVRQIRANTQVIWALEDTNKVARQLLAGAESILGHAGEIVQAQHEADVRQGRVQ